MPYAVETYALDLQELKEVARIWDCARPDIVINAAGVTKLADCQRTPQIARQLNVGLPEQLVTMAGRTDTRLVLFSSDQVCRDTYDAPHREDSHLVCPDSALAVYAWTKYELERHLSPEPKVLTIRTSNIIGAYSPPNGTTANDRFYCNVVTTLKSGRFFDAMDEGKATPVMITDVIGGILYLLDKRTQGLFNLASPESMTKYDLARTIAAAQGLSIELVRPMHSKVLPNGASYGVDTSLDVTKISNFGYTVSTIAQGLSMNSST